MVLCPDIYFIHNQNKQIRTYTYLEKADEGCVLGSRFNTALIKKMTTLTLIMLTCFRACSTLP